jgi:hypothetical protein
LDFAWLVENLLRILDTGTLCLRETTVTGEQSVPPADDATAAVEPGSRMSTRRCLALTRIDCILDCVRFQEDLKSIGCLLLSVLWINFGKRFLFLSSASQLLCS